MKKTFKILGILVIILVLIYVSSAIYSVKTLPGIAYGSQGITIFNCDEPRNKNAVSVCPRLFCEKYLRDNRKIDEGSIVQATDQSGFDSSISIIQGIIKTKSKSDQDNLYYYCRMDGYRVLGAEIMTGKEWATKLINGEFD